MVVWFGGRSGERRGERGVGGKGEVVIKRYVCACVREREWERERECVCACVNKVDM